MVTDCSNGSLLKFVTQTTRGREDIDLNGLDLFYFDVKVVVSFLLRVVLLFYLYLWFFEVLMFDFSILIVDTSYLYL